MRILVLVLVLCATAVHADNRKNEAGLYALTPLPAAAAEALRLDTNEREDQQPPGRMVFRRDEVLIGLPDLPSDIEASLIIGLSPNMGVGDRD